MDFVKLVEYYKKDDDSVYARETYVNLDNVVNMRRIEDTILGSCTLINTHMSCLFVSESPEEILKISERNKYNKQEN